MYKNKWLMWVILLVLLGSLLLTPMTVSAADPRATNVKVKSAVQPAIPGLATADLNTVTATDMVNQLLGNGVSVSNVSFIGTNNAGGLFSGGTGIIGFEKGIILCSGDIANVIGPNTSSGITGDNQQPGDPDLTAIISDLTYDAAVLEFDFIPAAGKITFNYVFASDEYNEYVFAYNDVFAFFVNGINQALIPGTNTAVSINDVNLTTNSSYYINNDMIPGAPLNTEMDGLTRVLSLTTSVNPGVTNHIKLAIADALDSVLDSDVFIEASSFISTNLILTPADAENEIGTTHTLFATFTDENGQPVVGQVVTFTVTGANPQTGTGVTDASGVATWSYTGTNGGEDTIVASTGTSVSNTASKEWGKLVPPVPELSAGALLAIGLIGIAGFFITKRNLARKSVR